MDWSSYGDRWKDSVLQLFVIHAQYKPDRPYADPIDKKRAGTAFIIDIERGYVVTNAHVVSNAIAITGRINKLGKRDLSLELIGICKDKDLALCKISHDDIEVITKGVKDPKSINMIFGDSMSLNQTDEVMAIGYPLGHENIKYTTGIVSGFESQNDNEVNEEEFEDTPRRSPTYIQITAAINGGNSGGPLINNKGEVIGINAAGYLYAQNIGYAIPSRTFLSVFCELIRQPVVRVPTLALDWNKTTPEMMEAKTGDSRAYGIYVRKIYPDSCVDSLEEGDVIKRLDYNDYLWASKDAFNVLTMSHENLCNAPTKTISCYFDRYGDAWVGSKEIVKDKTGATTESFVKLQQRKLTLAEIVDMIYIGSDVKLQICRDQVWYEVMAKYEYKEVGRLTHMYPRVEHIEYEIFAGICCSNLNLSHIDHFPNLEHHNIIDKNRYIKRVVICQVFPDTSASRYQILKPGYLIETLNGTKISTLEDIRKILRSRPLEISIVTTNKAYFMVSTATVIPEDKKAIKNFNIRGYNYLLNSEKI